MARLWRWRPQSSRAVVSYHLLIAAGLVLFCAFVYGDPMFGGVYAAGWIVVAVPRDLLRVRRARHASEPASLARS